MYYFVSAILNVQETINLYTRSDARSFESEFTKALELCHTLYLLQSDAHCRTCEFNYKKGNKQADMAVTYSIVGVNGPRSMYCLSLMRYFVIFFSLSSD